MVLKAVWVTNLPVKCQKLKFSDIQWTKGRVHSVTYNELIMINFYHGQAEELCIFSCTPILIYTSVMLGKI